MGPCHLLITANIIYNVGIHSLLVCFIHFDRFFVLIWFPHSNAEMCIVVRYNLKTFLKVLKCFFFLFLPRCDWFNLAFVPPSFLPGLHGQRVSVWEPTGRISFPLKLTHGQTMLSEIHYKVWLAAYLLSLPLRFTHPPSFSFSFSSSLFIVLFLFKPFCSSASPSFTFSPFLSAFAETASLFFIFLLPSQHKSHQCLHIIGLEGCGFRQLSHFKSLDREITHTRTQKFF